MPNPDYDQILREKLNPYARSLLAPEVIALIADAMDSGISHRERVERVRSLLKCYYKIIAE